MTQANNKTDTSGNDFWFDKCNEITYLRDLAESDYHIEKRKSDYYKSAYESLVKELKSININELVEGIAEEFKKHQSEQFYADPEQKVPSSSGANHFVYIGRKSKTSEYKIGISADIENRIKALKTGCPGFNIIATLNTKSKTISSRIEKGLHASFSEQSIGGEWFSLSDEHIEWIISQFRFSKHMDGGTE